MGRDRADDLAWLLGARKQGARAPGSDTTLRSADPLELVLGSDVVALVKSTKVFIANLWDKS